MPVAVFGCLSDTAWWAGNRLSLTVAMFQQGDSPIRLSMITAGGSQAVFFKVNTLGENAFLDDVKQLLERILRA